MVRFRVAGCCLQTGGESDKIWIDRMIETGQWRCAPQIRPAPRVGTQYMQSAIVCY